MLEKILREVCQEMSSVLSENQIKKLKNVLFINFHGISVYEDKNEIVLTETDNDTRLIKMFVASKKISGREEKTMKQYVDELKRFRNIIGKNFKDITTMDIRWYLGMMQEQRRNKMSTIQNKIHYINSFYTFLLNEEIIAHNPVSKIETPKIERVIRKPFYAEDMESIRKNCKNIRDRTLIEFIYSTGLRVSELSSLNIGDIDMEKMELNVIGKGSKERTVYFSAVAKFYLKDYFIWRMEVEKLTLEELKERPLFIGIRKPYKRITKSGIESLCRDIAKKSGVKDVYPHRFRRTFATNMINRGMKLEELMKLMGHTKMDTTLIYCYVNQENIKNSYNKYSA